MGLWSPELCKYNKMFLVVLVIVRSLGVSSNKQDGDVHTSNYSLLESLRNILSGNSNNSPPFHSGLPKTFGDTHHSLRKVRTRHNNIEDALRYLVRELATSAGPVSELHFQTSSTQELTLPRNLYSKGGSKKELGRELQPGRDLLKYPSPQIQKRRWNRLSIQTRYAPLGTRLVPIRKLPNSGATLLRYGRSSADH